MARIKYGIKGTKMTKMSGVHAGKINSAKSRGYVKE